MNFSFFSSRARRLREQLHSAHQDNHGLREEIQTLKAHLGLLMTRHMEMAATPSEAVLCSTGGATFLLRTREEAERWIREAHTRDVAWVSHTQPRYPARVFSVSEILADPDTPRETYRVTHPWNTHERSWSALKISVLEELPNEAYSHLTEHGKRAC